MSDENRQDAPIDAVEIEPLADEALEEVAGGVCSVAYCSGTAA